MLVNQIHKNIMSKPLPIGQFEAELETGNQLITRLAEHLVCMQASSVTRRIKVGKFELSVRATIKAINTEGQ